MDQDPVAAKPASPAPGEDDAAVEAVLGPAGEERSARQVRFSFGGLLVTQLLGAFNDNVLKQFILLQLALGGLWHDYLGSPTVGIVSVAYTLPFILFSGYAGQFADQQSKRWVAVLLKTVEIPIVCIAGVGIHYHQFWTTFAALILLSTHSAFFGPAKYGMIPEILPERRLPRGNGSINMTTNMAIIMGVVFGGFASDYLRGDPLAQPPVAPEPNLCFYILLLAAIAGRITVMFVQKLDARDPKLRIHPSPFHTYRHALGEIWRAPNLRRAAFGWSFFYFVAACAMLSIPELKQYLMLDGAHPSDTQISYINAALGIAIGVGSLAAGLLSRGQISIRAVWAGGIGLTAGLLVFPFLPRESYAWAMTVLCVLGFWAGFYLVPLMSYIQATAPAKERGQFLGTVNFLSMVAFAAGSGVYAAMRYKLEPHWALLLCGVLFIVVLDLMRDMKLTPATAKAQA